VKKHDWVEQSVQAKPPNHGTYQVWHGGAVHALDVESVDVRDVDRLTKKPPEKWKDHPAVTLRIENPRATREGDVIVDPTCGAWEVQRHAYVVVEPPAPIKERIEREGITPLYLSLLQGWLRHLRGAAEKAEELSEQAHGRGREM
jgi:hypothetical protein